MRQEGYQKNLIMDAMAQKIILEASDILGDKVVYPVSTDKLTIVIEKYVDDLDLYANLREEFGDKNIEGVTIFFPFKNSYLHQLPTSNPIFEFKKCTS